MFAFPSKMGGDSAADIHLNLGFCLLNKRSMLSMAKLLRNEEFMMSVRCKLLSYGALSGRVLIECMNILFICSLLYSMHFLEEDLLT